MNDLVTRRSQARTLFLDGSTLVAVSKQTGVPLSTVRSWSQEDGWQAARRSLKAEMVESTENALAKASSENLPSIVLEQFRLFKQMQGKIGDSIAKYEANGWVYSPSKIKDLMAAMKSIGDGIKSLAHVMEADKSINVANVQGNALIQFGSGAAPLGPAPEPKTIEAEVLPPKPLDPEPDPF